MTTYPVRADGELAAPSGRSSLMYRHSVIVRLTHWIGAASVTILLMSGLQIFNAHPALYLGPASDFAHPIMAIGAAQENGHEIGVTTIFGHSFKTTGVLGLSGALNREERAFPAWLILPSHQDLATGRRWHFFFAWLLVFDGLIYLIYSLAGRHLWRDLIPSARQLRGIGTSILEHLRLRFPRGEAAKHYNVLQRLSYLAILFIIIPLLIFTGLTMSPGLDAAFSFLPSVFGGRQSARSIHFLCAFLVLGFAVVHMTMVLLSGSWNNMRSMLTGWYKITPEVSSHGRTN
jgi:thiosulfate reductase cytochrome b subunit